MTPQRWSQIKEVFAAAREMRAADRGAYLDSACGDDRELRAEVEHLLAKDDSPSLQPPRVDFLNSMAPELAPGQMLAQYRVEAKLGQGGMGAVYRAFDTRLQREVALKVLSPEHFADTERKQRMLREARAASALNHPNIVTVHEISSEGGVDFIVMELVDGDTLEGPLPLATALDRAGQVAEALAVAHEHGIIHRDLKPANLKVTQEGRVKVLDFGLAKATWGIEGKPDLSQTVTVTGASVAGHIVGTPGYMSPEQARGAEVDQRTDIWAFGCLSFELLAGKRAFAGETVSDTIAAVLEHEPDWGLCRLRPRPGYAACCGAVWRRMRTAGRIPLQRFARELRKCGAD